MSKPKMMVKKITKTEVLKRIKGLPEDAARKVVCSLVGHSLITTACFGYVYCGRCEAQIADQLGGYGFANAENCVQVGHNCPTCRENYEKLDWRHKLLAPDPFVTEEAEVSNG